MIFFHSIPIVEEVGRLMGESYISHKPIYPFTLYGYTMQGDVLTGLQPDLSLIPRECVLNDTEEDFDYYYWKQLLESEPSKQCLYKILYLEYLYGPNCIICIQTNIESPFSMSVTESLMTFISSAYGLSPKLILTYEDLYDALVDEYSGFSQEGISRITQDMVYYTRMNMTDLSFIPEG